MLSFMQQNAICHTKGPARVLAGPGSGKTFTIIQRLNYLINTLSVSPDEILCITFTKASAIEMQQRYQMQMTITDTGSVCFGTVHSICYHILKESGKFRQYSLIDESKKRKLLAMILQNKGLYDYNNFTIISEFLYAIGRKKNDLPYREDNSIPAKEFEEIYQEYLQALCERKLFDFDDIINNALLLLTTNETIREKWQHQFSYLMVDEFQDINHTQYQLIKLLAMPQNNLFVVGDDDQAIYGFRGAAPDIMKQFEKDFPDAGLLYLTENYRSKEAIVALAEKIISENQNRIPKRLIPKKQGGIVNICYEETRKAEEAKLIYDILNSKEIISQSALIVRTNIEAMQYTGLLKAHRIPVKERIPLPGTLSKEHFIKEDFMAFLRFCKEGRKRIDFMKIMNKPERYLSRQALISEVVTQKDLLAFYKNNAQMQEKIKQLFVHFQKAESMSFSMSIRYFRNVIGYDTYLKECASSQMAYEEFIRVADELQLLCKKQKNRESCESFFKRMEQESVHDTSKATDSDGISVITMHGAKGLEFLQVFLPDVNEGVIPAKRCKSIESIEEERRLLYVAVTRAKNNLYIYYTKERGRNPSRFINHKEILK